MHNHGSFFSIHSKKILPLTVAISACLLTACGGGTTETTAPSNASTPVASTTPQNWEAPEATTTSTQVAGLDEETLAILNDLLEARDMSMVEGDRMLVERYGNLWDRVRRGYRLSQPANNDRIEAQKAWFGGKQDYLNRLTARASRYLYHTVTEAERRGIPTELALLPIIESSYDPSATSNASAAGLWQFIPSTGRIYGLTQSSTYDGRRDVIESTRAAYDFLTSLYNQFGSWELALAAYNAGPGRVSRAIEANRAQGLSTDYWSLRLPTETMNYVPRFMAVAQIIGNPSYHGASLPAIANHAHFRAVPVNTGVSLQEVSNVTGVSVYELQLLNPALTSLKVDIAAPSRVVIPDSLAAGVDTQLKALTGYGYNANVASNTTYIRPDTATNPNPESAQALKQNNTLPTTKSSITAQNTIIQEPPLSKEERDFIANQIRQNTSGVEPINVKDGNIALGAVQTGQSVLEAQGKTKSLQYDNNPAQTGVAVTATQNTQQPFPIQGQSTPVQIHPVQTQPIQVQPVQVQPTAIQPVQVQPIAQPVQIQPVAEPVYNAQPIYEPPTYQPPVMQAMTHKVQAGDTLIGIAGRYGVTVQEIRAWNGMSATDTLKSGKTLKLYDDGSAKTKPVISQTPSTPVRQPTTPVRQPTPPTPKRSDSHTIVAGDTLTSVAATYGLTIAQLASYNNLGTNDHLVRGQKLWLVAGKVKPTPQVQPQPPKTTAPTKIYKGKTTSYKIQRGDTLLGLANRLGVTADDIASLNANLSANDPLVAGQTITVPATTRLDTPTPAPTAKDGRYTIGSGDTLIGVAAKYGLDVAELAAANGLDDKARLVAGQSLIIPKGRSKVQAKPEPKTEPKTEVRHSFKSSENYKVQSGETLTSLANRYGVSIAELAGANGLDSKARLNAGQTIKVPKLTTTHTVRSGDSLISLAKRYGIAVADLAKMNNLSPNDGIKIGQTLTVPNR